MRQPGQTITLITCLVLFAALTAAQPLVPSARTPLPSELTSAETASIRDVVTRFYQAFESKDIETMTALWSSESPSHAKHKETVEKIFKYSEAISARILDMGPMKKTPEGVVVRAKVDFTGAVTIKGTPYKLYESTNRYLILRKAGHLWQIHRHIAAEAELAHRLIAEKDRSRRKVLLSSEPELLNSSLADELLREGNRLWGTVGWREVLEIFDLELEVAETISDKGEIIKALNGIGAMFGKLNEPERARSAYQRGLEIAKEIGDKRHVAIIAGNIADVADDKDEALKHALELAHSFGEKRYIVSALGKIGNRHTMRGEYTRSKDVLEEALKLRREIGEAESVSLGLSNLASLYVSLGDYERAKSHLEESIKLSESVNDLNGSSFDLFYLGSVYETIGDNASAMGLYSRSLELAQKLDPGDDAPPVLLSIGSLLFSQGNITQAENTYLQAMSKFEKNGDNYHLSRVLSGLSRVYQRKGDLKRALIHAVRAHELFVKEKDAETVFSLLQLSDLYFELGEAERGYKSLTDALELSVRLRAPLETHLTQRAIAKRHFQHGNLREALARLEAARTSYEHFHVRSDAWEYYQLLGEIHNASEKSELATKTFDLAISLIEKQRATVVGDAVERQRYLASRLAPYQSMLSLKIGSNDNEAAFRYSEKMRARVLVDLIGTGQIKTPSTGSLARVNEERSLREELISANAKLSKSTDPTQTGKLTSEVEQKRAKLEAVRLLLYAEQPVLRLTRGEMTPISLAETSLFLPDSSSMILEFVVAKSKLFAFILTPGRTGDPELRSFRIAVTEEEIKNKIESFRSKIAAGSLEFQSASRDLYDLLLKPVEKSLKEKTNIIIVPDGPLWDLPFQALEDENGKNLIEKAAVSYVPSLTALREMQKKAATRSPATGADLLAFGNPIVGKATKARVQQVFMSEKLDPLPESERLVKELEKMYGPGRSSVYVGNDARETTAKAEMPNYRIVQLATHGILNNVSPMYSHLVLAQNEKDTNEDGLLEAWEMKDLDLRADMVILSACDTARGKISSGEGVIGMTWAMFIAGAPTTIASQWKVESSSTTELMLEFHRQLLAKKRVSKAEALRRASLKVMKMRGFSHPSYWAGFVLVGDGS